MYIHICIYITIHIYMYISPTATTEHSPRILSVVVVQHVTVPEYLSPVVSYVVSSCLYSNWLIIARSTSCNLLSWPKNSKVFLPREIRETVCQVTTNIDTSHIVSRSHTHPSKFTLWNLSHLNLVSIFRCSSPLRNPVYVRWIDPTVLPCSLSLHRHP